MSIEQIKRLLRIKDGYFTIKEMQEELDFSHSEISKSIRELMLNGELCVDCQNGKVVYLIINSESILRSLKEDNSSKKIIDEIMLDDLDFEEISLNKEEKLTTRYVFDQDLMFEIYRVSELMRTLEKISKDDFFYYLFINDALILLSIYKYLIKTRCAGHSITN